MIRWHAPLGAKFQSFFCFCQQWGGVSNAQEGGVFVRKHLDDTFPKRLPFSLWALTLGLPELRPWRMCYLITLVIRRYVRDSL